MTWNPGDSPLASSEKASQHFHLSALDVVHRAMRPLVGSGVTSDNKETPRQPPIEDYYNISLADSPAPDSSSRSKSVYFHSIDSGAPPKGHHPPCIPCKGYPTKLRSPPSLDADKMPSKGHMRQNLRNDPSAPPDGLRCISEEVNRSGTPRGMELPVRPRAKQTSSASGPSETSPPPQTARLQHELRRSKSSFESKNPVVSFNDGAKGIEGDKRSAPRTATEFKKSRMSWHLGSPHPSQSESTHAPSRGYSAAAFPAIHLRYDISQLTDDVVNMVLKTKFGVELEDLHEPLEAWSSVKRCIQELALIVGTETTRLPLTKFEVPFHQAAGSQDSSNHEPRQASGVETPGSTSQKRRGTHSRDDNGEEDDEGSPQDDDRDGDRRKQNIHPVKRVKGQVQPDFKYSCPFRKRNPLKFNIRQWEPCATGHHGDISSVKKHVQAFHRKHPHKCYRCHKGFATEIDLTEHLRVSLDQICPLRDTPLEQQANNDPEDGITIEIRDVLKGRKNHSKVMTWRELWRLLFPDDEIIPLPNFEPPLVGEMIEFQHALQKSLPSLVNAVKAEIRDALEKLDTEGNPVCPTELCQRVSGVTETEFQRVLESCRRSLYSGGIDSPPVEPRQTASQSSRAVSPLEQGVRQRQASHNVSRSGTRQRGQPIPNFPSHGMGSSHLPPPARAVAHHPPLPRQTAVQPILPPQPGPMHQPLGQGSHPRRARTRLQPANEQSNQPAMHQAFTAMAPHYHQPRQPPAGFVMPGQLIANKAVRDSVDSGIGMPHVLLPHYSLSNSNVHGGPASQSYMATDRGADSTPDYPLELECTSGFQSEQPGADLGEGLTGYFSNNNGSGFDAGNLDYFPQQH